MSQQNTKKALSTSAQDGRKWMFSFGLIFALAGALVLHFFFFMPVFNWFMAQSWEEVECRIDSSEVGSHSDSDGTTYSVDITYSYSYKGNSYTGDRYDFMGGSSSGYDNKQRVVAQYPAGSTKICYVNPLAPEESVLSIHFQWTYFIGLFGGIFLGVGMLMMSGRIGNTAKRKVTTENTEKSESIILKPAVSPWAKLLGVLLFVTIWDGVSGFLVYQAWTEEGFGVVEVFAFIFGGIGALALLWIPYQVMAMFNPRPELIMSPAVIPLGGTAQLSWRFTGSTHRLEKLSIQLVGEEVATYRQGTDTRTARSTFFKFEIVAADNPVDIKEGCIGFALPEQTMHSFDAGSNAIKWSIKMKGAIAKWPDVNEEFVIVVRPGEGKGKC